MNKVNLVGRITTTPTVETVDMKQETRFTVALLRANPSDTRIDYVSCVAYEKKAQFIKKNFRRGDNISIVGTIHTEKNIINNREIYSTRILVEEVHYIRDNKDFEFYR